MKYVKFMQHKINSVQQYPWIEPTLIGDMDIPINQWENVCIYYANVF